MEETILLDAERKNDVFGGKTKGTDSIVDEVNELFNPNLSA